MFQTSYGNTFNLKSIDRSREGGAINNKNYKDNEFYNKLESTGVPLTTNRLQ